MIGTLVQNTKNDQLYSLLMILGMVQDEEQKIVKEHVAMPQEWDGAHPGCLKFVTYNTTMPGPSKILSWLNSHIINCSCDLTILHVICKELK